MPAASKHNWEFRARFRRRAFGWKSQPAITRVRQAVTEIKKVARTDAVLAAEGAVLFLEKVSPALEQVDSSSGAIGSAVSKAVTTLADIIARAPADPATRDRWLERLFQAHADDQIPYIESLADHWGALCATPERASAWADRLLPITRRVLEDPAPGAFFHGTAACLSALHAAGRHDEVIALVEHERLWFYRQWAVKSLAAQGKHAEALAWADATQRVGPGSEDIDRTCEQILLAAGQADEAYRRYGLHAHHATTYLAWFRAVARTYPDRAPADILADLVALTPGDEGKWFAAAKDAGLYDQALALARRTPTAPQTLTRAARDFATKEPTFALEAGFLALHWLVEGYGYEVTGRDVINAYEYTLQAAANAGRADETLARIRQTVARETFGERFVTKILRSRLDLP